MNVFFHTITAIGVTALLSDPKILGETTSSKPFLFTAIFTFFVGMITHGVLDYVPHCYPINSKLDVFISLAMILILIWLAKKEYQIIVALSFLGSIFPDLVDLSFPILNKQLGFSLPVFDKIFPWHCSSYSGSIYSGDCSVSTLNHVLLVCTISVICWCKRTNLEVIFWK